MKRLLGFLLVFSTLFSMVFAVPVFAADVDSECSLIAIEPQPRTTIETVPYYHYLLDAYDGSQTLTDIVYRDIIVPTGCELVSHGFKIVSIEYNGYYENVQYECVTRIEFQYEVVRK